MTSRANPPGRTDVAYRVGTWSTFRARMVRSLPAVTVPPDGPPDARRPLAALTTRATDDPTIALIDAFACVCDVLTFYGERILNEGYLLTATQPRSVTELANEVGYRPAPGVAASTRLAFTVDPTHDADVVVRVGHPVQSVPGAVGEVPVTFETSEELVARAEWNQLRPKLTRVHPVTAGTTELVLAGVATRLIRGSAVVVVGAERRDVVTGTVDVPERWDLRRVTDVRPDALAGVTVVTLDRGLGDGRTPPAEQSVEVLTFDERGSLFGWNAPDVRMMSADVRGDAELVRNRSQWQKFALDEDTTRTALGAHVLDLDREYPAVVAGGWLCLEGPTEAELYRVTATRPASRTEFSLTGRVSRVYLDTVERLDFFRRRSTTVLLGSRPLPVAEEEDPTTISGAVVHVPVPPRTPLPIGRAVLVEGLAPGTGDTVVVATTVADYDDTAPTAILTLADELPELVRASVTIHANVAPATHGATVPDEVLGSADAAVGGQRHRLRHAPLTWVARPPTGAEPELEVRVNGLLWERVPSLYTAGPADRVYTLAADPDGVMVVEFGDGVHGARPPSGTENVRATSRTGLGLVGAVPAGRLTLLQSRPPGLVGVTNPAGAAGAAEPDSPDDVRRLAPRTVLTMDRLVSVQDYEDFTASFPGIGKARAVPLWDGRRGFVHLTVGTSDGRSPAPGDPTVAALEAAIVLRADPAHHVTVSPHIEVRFEVELGVLVDPAYEVADVLDAVRAALLGAFSFAGRQFSQPVATSEVIAVCHTVPGVRAVDLDLLRGADGRVPQGGVLVAAPPRWDGTAPTRAELLVLGPDLVDCRLHALEDT